MSFRLFIYYSGVGAAWAALIGWGLGQWLAPDEAGDVPRAAVQGLLLGGMVALGVALVDHLWSLPERFARPPWFVLLAAVVGPGALFTLWYLQKGIDGEDAGLRMLVISILILIVAVIFFVVMATMLWNLGGKRLAWLGPAVVAGGLAGLVGGLVGQLVSHATEQKLWAIIGWTLTGLLVGAALGTYDLIADLLQGIPLGPALRKIRNGVLGGTAGGLLGSLLFLSLREGLSVVLGKQPEALKSTSALGFTALGGCIGALIGWAQVILREAWIKVEAGFRPGRELILTKLETIIGRAEGCDVGLYGGKGVEKVHARIVQPGRPGGQFMLVDNATPAGTYLNDTRIKGPAPLHTGDLILIGNCALRFQEKKPSTGRPSTPARREREFKLE